MEEQLANELLQMVRAVKRVTPTSLSFAGKVITASEAASEDECRALFIQHLGRLLYLHCYSRKFNGEIGTKVTTDPTADELFVEQLSAANRSREYLDRGWQIIRQLPTGHFVAEKNGLTRILFVGEFISHSDVRESVKEGTSISVFCPRESKTMHPGFYYIFGESIGDQLDDSGLLRFYWNIKAEGASQLVALVTEQLNRFQLPFRFKLVNHPADYDRSDAAILYLNQRYFPVASQVLGNVHKQLRALLQSDTPLFSKQLEYGLGLAEEPTTGESFGQQRCRILATAIFNICASAQAGGELEEIARQFQLDGLSLEFPYRNAGSLATYEFGLV